MFKFKNDEGEIEKDIKASKLTSMLLDAGLKDTSSKIAIKAMKLGAIDYLQKDKNSFFHLLNILDHFFKEKSLSLEF